MTKDPLKNFTQLIYLSQINQAITLKSVSALCRVYSSPTAIDPKTSEGYVLLRINLIKNKKENTYCISLLYLEIQWVLCIGS